MNTRAYARDFKNQTVVFDVTNATSYEDAIESVKKEAKVKRVLCLVGKQPQVEAAPIPEEAVA